jgi:hypothetical protein
MLLHAGAVGCPMRHRRPTKKVILSRDFVDRSVAQDEVELAHGTREATLDGKVLRKTLEVAGS